ncbi:unnamed protein product [Allacma fusca]|uniref:Uncharacterized protein n=1 Tax=Allacma fusca TaxID=39272 RepID=A0A8J2P8K6_9HEXA|nr:unnamed protein product [Allacma fusca]
MKLLHHLLPYFVLWLFVPVISNPLEGESSGLEKRQKSLDMGKKRRQVFREDLTPLLGGKIPSGALEWTRLMFNNLDSRGISIPDGYLPSNDRIPPEGTRTEESRIRFFRQIHSKSSCDCKLISPYIKYEGVGRVP